ncbi:hypothetical protein M422DRAFT_241994 [Sphaerobolus stellatus SS14]|nr:hypothetical protein M422DRAFT_241994 [Sphaerobolus stellatus SS14]
MSRADAVTVSRSSSASSLDLADRLSLGTSSAYTVAEGRRTRKRISAAQLAQLEELYRLSSHPTREQRDSLAKRIQMETKSVTIWFQNKRQTDRKVALNNATSSRNLLAALFQNPTPNITITTPTSPPQHLDFRGPSQCDDDPRSFSDPRSTIKRSASYTSTSTITNTNRPRPSLDKVASRSEIRFTDHRNPPSRTLSQPNLLRPQSEHHAPIPTRSATIPSPVSPQRPLSREIWSNMLSSPVAPSSLPPPEILAYARARKTRNLDWACTVAEMVSKEDQQRFRGPLLLGAMEAAQREREYEEAIAMTEDEAELVTPHSSQDDPAEGAHIVRLTSAERASKNASGPAGTESWEEDEMHAALALCGLRG